VSSTGLPTGHGRTQQLSANLARTSSIARHQRLERVEAVPILRARVAPPGAMPAERPANRMSVPGTLRHFAACGMLSVSGNSGHRSPCGPVICRRANQLTFCLSLSSLPQRIFPFLVGQITFTNSPRPASEQGGSRSSRTRGGCVDADGAFDEWRTADGEVVGPIIPDLISSWRKATFADDPVQQARSPGEYEGKPLKPLRGNAGEPV